MGVWLYPLFRRPLGVMSCHIWVWGPGATELIRLSEPMPPARWK